MVPVVIAWSLRQIASINISETDDLLVFLHTTVPRVTQNGVNDFKLLVSNSGKIPHRIPKIGHTEIGQLKTAGYSFQI